jgi:N4-gp56 family major capsid protein
MSNLITTTEQLPFGIKQDLALKLVSVATPELIFTIAAEKHMLRQKAGDTVRFTLLNKFKLPLVPFSDKATTIPGQTLSSTFIDAKVEFYGTHAKILDVMIIQHQVDILNSTAYLLGINLRETEDHLTKDLLVSTGSFINAVGGVNGDLPTEIARSDISSVTETLRTASAKPIMDMVEGENRFGTSPVQNSFMALGHTGLQSQLSRIEGFIHHSKYGTQESVLKAEYGTIDDLRFLLSPAGSLDKSASAEGREVFETPCVGQDAYKIIEQSGYSTEIEYLPRQFSGACGQFVDLGYRFSFGAVITHEDWLINLRSTRIA